MRAPLVVLAASLTLVPAAAQAGFFESLFGLTPATAPAPTAAQPVAPQARVRHERRKADGETRRNREHHDHVKVAGGEHAPKAAGPKLQRTTGLMDDRTLRTGDAVMTRDGLRIFTGVEADHHAVDEFVPLRAAPHEKKGARLVLAAIDDAARLDIGRDRRQELQTGRSVSESAEAKRPSFTVPRAMVRYVGP